MVQCGLKVVTSKRLVEYYIKNFNLLAVFGGEEWINTKKGLSSIKNRENLYISFPNTTFVSLPTGSNTNNFRDFCPSAPLPSNLGTIKF